jgi:sulfite exporter TauE/SafE
MTLFLSLLPLYLFGNVHCLGMCGPLVMLIGQYRYRYCYFLGRILSFSLAGWLAGEAGAVLHVFLKAYHIGEVSSFLFGGFLCFLGLKALYGWTGPKIAVLTPLLSHINQALSRLMLKDQGWSTFLFGFLTVALPCGQTLVVFSACALSGDGYVGLFNGFALALLTTPSLVLAMHAHDLFKKMKHHYKTVLGICSLVIGALAFCRGFAEAGWISHWVLNPEAQPHYHVVIF